MLESKLKASSGDAPPALAAPGFKWVLVKEGHEAPLVAASQGGGPSRQSSVAGSVPDESAAAAGMPTAAAAAQPADDESVKVGGSLLWGSARAASWGGGAAASSGGSRPQLQQVAALQQQVRELEATRDRLSEELVRAATEASAGQAAQVASAAAKAQLADLQEQLTAAVELLGEKEELLEVCWVGACGGLGDGSGAFCFCSGVAHRPSTAVLARCFFPATPHSALSSTTQHT